jgi:ABC-type glutathione transport system ATPase component
VVYGLAILIIILVAPEGLLWKLKDVATARRKAREPKVELPVSAFTADPGPLPERPNAMAGKPILEVRNLAKSFGGLKAVQDVSFSVPEGAVIGIIGPNGAGKTTLFDVISGHAPATDGAVLFAGRHIEGLAPHAVCQAGIARTFQIPAVFPRQTVLANAVVGAEFGRRPRMFSSLGFDAEVIAGAREALAFVGRGSRTGRTPLGIRHEAADGRVRARHPALRDALRRTSRRTQPG